MTNPTHAALVALVARWRDDGSPRVGATAIRYWQRMRCADELEALLPQPGAGESAGAGPGVYLGVKHVCAECQEPLHMIPVCKRCDRTPEPSAPLCKVRAAGKTDPPQDCDWPFCGCDERATKVIETLQECGWGPSAPPARPQEPVGDARLRGPWQTVESLAPPRHAQHIVRRDGRLFTATPCYGMHEPWWVVRLMQDSWPNEADPVSMRPTDEWMPLALLDAPGPAPAVVTQEQIEALREQSQSEIPNQIRGTWYVGYDRAIDDVLALFSPEAPAERAQEQKP